VLYKDFGENLFQIPTINLLKYSFKKILMRYKSYKLTPIQQILAKVPVTQDINLVHRCLDFEGDSIMNPNLSINDSVVYLQQFEEHPFKSIRQINDAIDAACVMPKVRHQMIKEAVDLEIITDDIIYSSTGDKVYTGIPHYLMDGYTDLGSNGDDNRNGRAKFRFRKSDLVTDLIVAKSYAVEAGPKLYELEGTMDVLRKINRYIHKTTKFDDSFVQQIERNEAHSVVASFYQDDDGKHAMVCRQIAVKCQMMLQSAGIISKLKKGNFGCFGRHAWQNFRVGEQIYVCDFTQNLGFSYPSPVPICLYEPTDDNINHYKIKREKSVQKSDCRKRRRAGHISENRKKVR